MSRFVTACHSLDFYIGRGWTTMYTHPIHVHIDDEDFELNLSDAKYLHQCLTESIEFEEKRLKLEGPNPLEGES